MARNTASTFDTQDGAASVDMTAAADAVAVDAAATEVPATAVPATVVQTSATAADDTQLTGGEWTKDAATGVMTRVCGTEAPRHFSLKAPLVDDKGNPA